MMKYFLALLIMISVSAGLYAESLFDGYWKLDVLGSNQAWFLEYSGDGSALTINGVKSSQDITIDTENNTIKIPALNMMADVFAYKTNDDGTIDLSVPGKFNLDIPGMLTKAFANQKHVNSVTDDVYKALVEKIEVLMHQVPIIRLTKIDKDQA